MSIISCYHNISKPITNYTIFGERHSGTNFLENVVSKNLDINPIWKFGWKHWIGSGCHWNKFITSQDTLFIGIVRNIYDWIGGMMKLPHHLLLKENTYEALLSYPVASGYIPELFISYGKIISGIKDINKIIIQDERNYITQAYYKNIFEARYFKNIFLYHYMPFLVDNFILIRYEDFLFNHGSICATISKTFDIAFKRRYRIRHSQTEEAKNKKPYNLPDNVIKIINENTNWAGEYIFGYKKRFIEER